MASLTRNASDGTICFVARRGTEGQWQRQRYMPSLLPGTPAEIRLSTYVLVSPGFAQSFGSGGEAEGLHFVGVLSFDDEFGEDVALVGIEEKFGHSLA
jgi:hypothetical protein